MLVKGSKEADEFSLKYIESIIDQNTKEERFVLSEEAMEYLAQDTRLAQVLFVIAEEAANNPDESCFRVERVIKKLPG